MATVKQKFRDYKESISMFTKREADYTSMIQEASPPEAIYVPTAAVHSNLKLIQKRSSFTVWEQAPASVRSPTCTPTSGYKPPTQQRQYTPLPPTQHNIFPNAAYPPLSSGKPSILPQYKGPPTESQPPPQNRDRTTQDMVLTGDDTTTTHSQMTKSLTTTQNKFAEIEAAIRRQQHAITQHQEELTNINDRTLTTLSLVQTTAGDVLQLTEDTTRQFTELQNEIRREAAAQAAAQQTGFENMAALFHRLTSTTVLTPPSDHVPTQSANEDSQLSAPDDTNDADRDSYRDNLSTATMETDNHSSTHARSPAKKRN
jgi:hypothetical protein